jgi:hypothetical protein
MATYKIVEIIPEVNGGGKNPDRKGSFAIYKKGVFGTWKEVKRSEITSSEIHHDTYQEAEDYMYKKYMGHGRVEKSGNIYKYSAYSFTV